MDSAAPLATFASLATLEEALGKARSPEPRLAALTALATALRKTDIARAESLATEARSLAVTLHDETSEAENLLTLGFAAYRRADYPLAQTHADRSLDLFTALRNPNGILGAHHLLGNTAVMTVRYADALTHYQEMLACAAELGDRQQTANALINLGTAHEKRYDYPQALESFRTGLALMQELGDISGEASTLKNIGVLYEKLSDYPVALDYYQRSLALRETLGDLRLVARSLNTIGMIHFKQSAFLSALTCFERSLPLLHGDRYEEAYTRHYIGNMYTHLGRGNDALIYFEDALRIRRDIGDKKGETHTLYASANALRDLGNVDAARARYEESLALCEAIGERYYEAETLRELGELSTQASQTEHAILFIQRSLAVAEPLGFKDLCCRAHRALADAYAAQHNTGEALHHFKIFHALEKEMFNEQSDQRLKHLHVSFEVGKKEKENDLLRQRLEAQERELLIHSQCLIEGNESSAEMRDRLLDIKRAVTESTGRDAHPIIDWHLSVIEDRLDPNRTWTHFEQQFSKTHPDFLKRLSKKCADLTPTELKICAMLRAGHSTKEIAQLLFITGVTVNEHRSNIRKKLRLKDSQNLSVSIARL